MTSLVADACHANFRYGLLTLKPGVFLGTMKVEMAPRVPLGTLAAANRIEALSSPMLVTNRLVPFRTHSSPSGTAVVFRAAASDPESGSVRPNAPISELFECDGSH